MWTGTRTAALDGMGAGTVLTWMGARVRVRMRDQGMIIERGTHSQLLQIPGGEYANLWQRQQEAMAEGDAPAPPGDTKDVKKSR